MLCLCVDRFGRYVTLYVFPILMVFIWLVIIGSTTSKIVADKQMALEEVCAHALSFVSRRQYIRLLLYFAKIRVHCY